MRFRLSDRLRERVGRRVEVDDDVETQSEAIREALRQFCLDRELREGLDAGDDETIPAATRGGEL